MEPNSSRLRPRRAVPQVELLEERVVAAAGALDPTFGEGGQLVLSNIRRGAEEGRALVVQGDGKIVVAGFAQNANLAGAPYRIRVSRLHANGRPDATFGTDGSTMLPIRAGRGVSDLPLDHGVYLALDSAGKILVASRAHQGDDDWAFVTARLSAANGALDPTFGNSGIATVDFDRDEGNGDDRLRGLTLDNQNRIVLVGTAAGPTRDLAVVRLLPNGSPDVNFGTNGQAVLPFDPGGDDGVTGVAMQGDRILVSGYNRDGADSEFVVVRLTEDGAPDLNFGTNGIQTIDCLPTEDERGANHATALAVQKDSKIVVAGHVARGSGGFDFAVARLQADGPLDRSFNSTGTRAFSFGENWISDPSKDWTNDQANGVLLQPDGKIVLAGYNQRVRGNPSEFGFALARLNSDGAFDSSFGVGGKNSYIFFPGEERGTPPDGAGPLTDDKIFDVALQGDGKLVLAGNFSWHPQGGERFALARLDADSVSPLPQPPPLVLPQPPRELKVALVSKGAKGKKRLFVRIAFADSGEVVREQLCPFQKTVYTAIAAAASDQDGDGFRESILLTARKGRTRYRRTFGM